MKSLDEWIDSGDVHPATLRLNLRDQMWLNRRLGGTRTVLRYIRSSHTPAPRVSVPRVSAPFDISDPLLPRPLLILDLACGGGDLSRYLVDLARKLGETVRVIAVDRHPGVLAAARGWSADYPEISFVRADLRQLPFGKDNRFDLAVCTNTLHHLSAQEIPPFLHRIDRICRGMIVMADIRRSRLSSLLFPLFARLVGLHPMSRHDGLHSLRRAFTSRDLQRFADQAGLHNSTVHCGPLRVLLVRLPLGAG